MNDVEELTSHHRVVLRLKELGIGSQAAVELIFDDWRWFRRRIPSANGNTQDGASERVSAEAAYRLARQRLEPSEIPGELCFHAKIGVPARVDSCDTNKTCQFDPRRGGWRLVGHFFDNWYPWYAQFLFESDGTYLRIFETGHIWDPKAQILSPPKAAEWFVTANIPIPEELQPYADSIVLKPILAVAKDDADGHARASNPAEPPTKDPVGDKATRDTGNDIGRMIYEMRSMTPQPSMKAVRNKIVEMGFADQHERTSDRKLTDWCTANNKTVPKSETNRGRKPRKGRPS